MMAYSSPLAIGEIFLWTPSLATLVIILSYEAVNLFAGPKGHLRSWRPIWRNGPC